MRDCVRITLTQSGLGPLRLRPHRCNTIRPESICCNNAHLTGATPETENAHKTWAVIYSLRLIGSKPRLNCSYVVSIVKGTVTLPNALIRGGPQSARDGISCDTVEPAESTAPSPIVNVCPGPHTIKQPEAMAACLSMTIFPTPRV